MKNITEFIIEGNQDRALFNACMEMDNNETIYKQQYWPLVQNIVKIHNKGEFNIEKLENSSLVDKLCAACIKSAKVSISSDNRKKLRKLVTASLIQTMSNEGEELTKEEEDYMVNWDYNNTKVLNW